VEWSAIVGLGGLALGAFTAYLGFRARKAPYSERLYDRRLDAHGEIVRRLSELHDEVVGALTGGGTNVDTAMLTLHTRAPGEAFIDSYRRWRFFLTSKTNAPILNYFETFRSVGTQAKTASEARRRLDEAFSRVAEAAKDELQVDALALETRGLLGSTQGQSWGMVAPSSSVASIVALGAFQSETFAQFQDENLRPVGAGSRVESTTDLQDERDRAYVHNRNLFLTHTWRPSTTPNQVADISIRLAEHARRELPAQERRRTQERPLANGLVEQVEYHVGRNWFRGGSIVKTNAEDNFRLDISAYRSSLCVARVSFKDGGSVVLKRYLDFVDLWPLPVETSRARVPT
jgi:prokaryotic YEATS domain